MICRIGSTLVRAVPVLGLLAALMFPPLVANAPDAPTESTTQPTVTLTASGVDSPTVPRAQIPRGQSEPAGGYPLRRRRRLHLWFFNHGSGGRGGPFSWLVFGPLLAVVIAVVALPLYLRRRFRRRKSKQPGPDVADQQPVELGE